MDHRNANDMVEHDLGEFICGGVDAEALLGPEPFHWFTITRKNNSPIHARGQFVRAEQDGTISVVTKETGEQGIVFQCPAGEIAGVLEDDKPVDLNQST